MSDFYRVTIEVIPDDGSTVKLELSRHLDSDGDGAFALGSLIGQAVNGVWPEIQFCDGASFAYGLHDFLPEEFKFLTPEMDTDERTQNVGPEPEKR